MKKQEKLNSSKLKIIPLGGLEQIGMNITAFEYEDSIIVVDCGLSFPEDDMYGIDLVIPDVTYLKDNIQKVKGFVITHGHEDHIGGIPFLLREIEVPIYATELTAALIELKLEEHDQLTNTQVFVKKPGDKFRLGCFEVEMIHVNHSIADSVGLAIKTPIGTIVHTGDFKVDLTPLQGEMTDLARFSELGRSGVLALMMDSTNAERPGYTPTERTVGMNFEKLFDGCDKRIIITTFASNVDRIQQIINVAHKYKRKVAFTGRSLENILKVCSEIGKMDIPEGILVDMDHINSVPKNKLVIICTGSQGENMSALYRMAHSVHKQVSIDAHDMVIISASAIPGNEITIGKVIDMLFQRGAKVVYDKEAGLHVSGHASREELRMMLALTKPKYFIPVHGEYRMLCKHAELAKEMGVRPNSVVIAENGSVIEVTQRSIRKNGTVKAGDILVDGSGTNEIGSDVLSDRKHLADEGIVITSLVLSEEDGSLMAPPEITTRGFSDAADSAMVESNLKRIVYETLSYCDKKHITKTKLKANYSGYLYKTIRRSPMVVTVIHKM